jgi:hypothetical protein
MKQETLEEGAERIISDMGWAWENTESSARMVARHCAKSQERSYSEEEAIQLLIKFNQEIIEVEDVRGWFEQFKKK